jgi:hypothetical protein
MVYRLSLANAYFSMPPVGTRLATNSRYLQTWETARTNKARVYSLKAKNLLLESSGVTATPALKSKEASSRE